MTFSKYDIQHTIHDTQYNTIQYEYLNSPSSHHWSKLMDTRIFYGYLRDIIFQKNKRKKTQHKLSRPKKTTKTWRTKFLGKSLDYSGKKNNSNMESFIPSVLATTIVNRGDVEMDGWMAE